MAAFSINYPPGADRWNRAMLGAWRKGYMACKSGAALKECPYGDKRKPSGKLSWSRAFMKAWQDGWEAAQKEALPCP